MTTFYTPVNDAKARLTTPHVIGDGVLVVDNPSAFGSTFPIRVTVSNGVSKTIFAVSGISSSSLTISSTLEGTSDAAFGVGSTVEIRLTAGDIADLQSAVADCVLVVFSDGTSSKFVPTANTNTARAAALTSAFAAATSGSQVLIGPGTYEYLSPTPLPAIPSNITVIGSTGIPTKLLTDATSSSGGSIGSNTTVRRLQLAAPNGDCIIQTAQTGVTLEYVDFFIGSTGVGFGINLGAGSAILYKCRFFGLNSYFVGCNCTNSGAVLTLIDCAWMSPTYTPSLGEVRCTAGVVYVLGGVMQSAASTQINQSGSGVIHSNGLVYDDTKVAGVITPLLGVTGTKSFRTFFTNGTPGLNSTVAPFYLDKPYLCDGVAVGCGTSPLTNPSNVRIETSTDGTTWTTLVDTPVAAGTYFATASCTTALAAGTMIRVKYTAVNNMANVTTTLHLKS